MKIAVLSDIHQSEFWRKVVGQKDDFDRIIFLGDEFDCWENRWPFQIENAEAIIDFKEKNADKVDLCWSNHAISYFLNEKCSGFQKEYAFEIKEFYIKHKENYNPVYIYDKWIFSHAGVSVKWMKFNLIKELKEINQMFKDKPQIFKWTGPEGSGNNAVEGPLWIRPNALLGNFVPHYNQVVGHTENNKPVITKKNRLSFVFCDTYDHNNLTIVDTKKNIVEFIDLR
jgi:hypothetical protein